MSATSVPNRAPVNTGASEIFQRVRITDVYCALGGPKPRHNRGPAFWRSGDNKAAVSLNDHKNVWNDFVQNEGGGLIALVRAVLGIDRRDALRWLADYAGVALENASPEERRERARRLQEAETEARALIDWKQDTLDNLRRERNGLLDTYHGAKRFLFRYPEEVCLKYGGFLEFRWELAWEVQFTYMQRIDAIQAEIDRIEAAPYSELLPAFRSANFREAA